MSIYIRKIWQKDNVRFSIEWSDGSLVDYRLSDLQRQCPCAGCIDETTGLRLAQAPAVKEDVRAVRLANVGRYALRVQFTSGCSNGIYSYDMLYSLNSKRRC